MTGRKSDFSEHRNSEAACLLAVLSAVAACGDAEKAPQRCDQAPANAEVKVVAIDAQSEHTCAVLSPCGALCWGKNVTGQAGIDHAPLVATPIWVQRNLALRQVTTGNDHTCGASEGGAAYCWGSNDWQELDGRYDTGGGATPVPVADLHASVDQVAAGGFSSCALLVDGSAECWGTFFPEPSPTLVSGTAAGVAVANGGGHACIIARDGGVLCWGGNNAGQLGDAMQGVSRLSAAPVVGLPDATVRLALAQGVSCAVVTSGEVFCWGYGNDGVLGNGTLDSQSTPVKVENLFGVVDLDIRYHACAALADGSVMCWGTDVFLPGADGQGPYLTPVPVPGISRVVDIAVGFWYTCALTEDQEIYCWGDNGSHQLGLGENSPFWVDTPTRVDWRSALP